MPRYAVIGDTESFINKVAIIILQTEEPSHQRLSIPAHAVLWIGTLNSVLRLIAEHKGVDKQKILDTLY